ncbi:carbon-nitrogen hydrolase family protein [Kibdelosporangium philippinense]|uniref:Carbon-nitrogen hydrolase family protein n=1 Tax=Kibdelosporangium philippinense TaxID=211113 RepID=A0ABS8ZYA1_9PSEU|nr:carbon-nitrogen hydrolase family protein [Kibdelosporangium philippinense]MCE7011052.1 carbon-nitrogen hydrolase family protein [Kibdelosporangium philippinense]
MSKPLPVALVQTPQYAVDQPLDGFASDAKAVLADHPDTRLLVYPELHLCSPQRREIAAEPLDGPRSRKLGEIARDLGVWFIPGSVAELGDDGKMYNTALVFSPDGELVTSYRKVFTWKPHEPYEAGDRFVVFDIPDTGRIGLAICYDAWFPESARHLAWLGADLIINPVLTHTPDRKQEVVLAQANAIVNQVFVASINSAAPFGRGRSIIVGPEGQILAETPDDRPAVIALTLDLDEVRRVRERGTEGLNRMWNQFTDGDAPLDVPLYQGRIDAGNWQPRS